MIKTYIGKMLGVISLAQKDVLALTNAVICKIISKKQSNTFNAVQAFTLRPNGRIYNIKSMHTYRYTET